MSNTTRRDILKSLGTVGTIGAIASIGGASVAASAQVPATPFRVATTTIPIVGSTQMFPAILKSHLLPFRGGTRCCM